MGTVASLDPPALAVACGESATVAVTIRNTGAVVDLFQATVLGDPAAWCQVEPAQVSLLPGNEGVVTVTFTPPPNPTTPYGELRFGIRVQPQEDPDGVTVEEGVLTVHPYVDLRAEIVPQGATGRRRGRYDVSITNRGNATVHFGCRVSDPNAALAITVAPPTSAVGPGTVTRARVQVTTERILWRGANQTLPFTIEVQAAAAPGVPPVPPVILTATFQQTPVIPASMPRTLATLAALALGAIVVWAVVVRPFVQQTARAEVAAPLKQTDQNIHRIADKVGVQVEPLQGEPGTTGAPALTTPVFALLVVSSAPKASSAPTKEFALDDGKALSISQLVIQNPYGAKGVLVFASVKAKRNAPASEPIAAADKILTQPLTETGTQTIPFNPAIVLPPGRTLAIALQCNQAGNGGGSAADEGSGGTSGSGSATCDVSTLVTGFSRTA